MTKKNGLPSYIALPATGLLVLIIQLVFWHNDTTRIFASVGASVVSTLVPVTIIFGAILFNKYIEDSGAINVIKSWLANITPNPTAQLMIIGWAFAFMIEGASGFGTPAAIAAPLLVSLGFRALPVAILALVMNSVPVSFGAVGTPTWYGFSQLDLTGVTDHEAFYSVLGIKTALLHSVASLVIPLLALAFVVSWSEIRKNLVFIYLSVASCVIPYFLIAQFNYEFPALLGGAIGLLVSVFIAKKGIGISKDFNISECGIDESSITTYSKVDGRQVFRALFPFILLIGFLVITRIKQLPFKAALQNNDTLFNVDLGLFNFAVSKSFTFNFNNIFGTDISDKYQLLYVPSLIPFIITVIICSFVLRDKAGLVPTIVKSSLSSVKLTFVALFGAFVMVKLMMLTTSVDGQVTVQSMVNKIGTVFSSSLGQYWLPFASYLGAIGAFFSGSNTVSNLTFGSIQEEIAKQINYPVTTVLALQSIGGAMGNMICLNNIIAVCSVTAVVNQEGYIIKKTFVPMFIYGLIAIGSVFVFSLFAHDFWLSTANSIW